MAISHVGSASWDTNSLDDPFTLTKPSGTTNGDLMVAVVAVNLYPSEDEVDINLPVGWTLLADVYSPPNLQMFILYRFATSSEPGSWNGSLSTDRFHRVTIVGTYRGVSSLDVYGETTQGSGTSLTSHTVSNPLSSNWRILFGAYHSGTRNYTIDSTENSLRKLDGATGSLSGGTEVALWDSGGTVGTGNTNRRITRGAVWECAATWIGILGTVDTSVPGTMALSLPLLSVGGAAAVSFTGTMAGTLPQLAMTSQGIATPPDGDLSVAVEVGVSMSGHSETVGTLDVLLLPVVDIVTETRFFGIRVVTPESESRVTRPRLGAVD